jgi:hypothetical protein
VMPHRILERKGLFFFVTGVTSRGDDIRFAEDSCPLLKNEFVRQTGIDLFIVMSEKGSISSPGKCESELYPFPDENEDPVSLPWNKTYADPLPHKTLFLLSGTTPSGSRAYRTMRGANVCQTDKNNICRIHITFRGHKIISVNAKTMKINDGEEPASWIEPDSLLMKVFNK